MTVAELAAELPLREIEGESPEDFVKGKDRKTLMELVVKKCEQARALARRSAFHYNPLYSKSATRLFKEEKFLLRYCNTFLTENINHGNCNINCHES